jgi:hypothetical protein
MQLESSTPVPVLATSPADGSEITYKSSFRIYQIVFKNKEKENVCFIISTKKIIVQRTGWYNVNFF